MFHVIEICIYNNHIFGNYQYRQLFQRWVIPEHLLFQLLIAQSFSIFFFYKTTTTNFWDLKFFMYFHNFKTIFWGISEHQYNLAWGHMWGPKKMWVRTVQLFWRLSVTNKQTKAKQCIYIEYRWTKN